MNKYKVRLTEVVANDDRKWKTITVTAEKFYTQNGDLLFIGANGGHLRAFATGEWSRVRQIDAA